MSNYKRLLSVFLVITLLNRIRLPAYAENQPPETAYSVLYSAISQYQNEADVSRFEITPAELRTLYSKVLADSPELFYVDTGYSYTYNGKQVITVTLGYNMTPDEISDARRTVREYVIKMLESAPGESELQTVLYLHDKICGEFEYDETHSVYNIYDFIIGKRGVCQAYSGLYQTLLTAAGIQCKTVASSDMAHIWNAVKIDGEWYNIDVTWDDSEPDLHEYFLKSDGYMLENGHFGFESICNSAKYDNILPGDINGDGLTDGRDVTAFRYLQSYSLQGDLNCDGKNDETDLDLLRKSALEYYFRIN